MVKEIQIGNKTVSLLANGATPYYYTSTFKEDFFEFLSGKPSDAKTTVGIQRLAYIMACQADGSVRKASVDGFLTWLEDFMPNDLIDTAADIMDVYAGTQKTMSVPKK